MSRSNRSGTHPVTRPGAYSLTARDVPSPWLRLVDVQSEIVAERHAEAKPRPRKCASKPGVNGALIGRRFGDWWVRARLTGGKVEVVCMGCMRTYERCEASIVRGESRKCARCSGSDRKAG